MTIAARARRTVLPALLCAVLVPMGLALPASAAPKAPQATAVVARIGSESLTEADIVASDPVAFQTLQEDFEREQHHLQVTLAESRHGLLEKQLNHILDERALALEARARSVAPDVVRSEISYTPVTEEDMHAFYEANRSRIPKTYDEVTVQMRDYLNKQRQEGAARRFYDELRARYGIRSDLPALRFAVADTGPVRGPAHATVTIVEFGDFQCPYCRAAEASLRSVLAKHPQDVRLVFRHLPLEKIHPNALAAAQAAVCAQRQGKFWEMHDAMYGNQSALGLEGLKKTAAGLNLDADRFERCLADSETQKTLEADARAALELGLAGTPYFFVNGRPLDGNVPLEQFENLVSDELQRAARPGS